jgi:tetratricopeptide (TPR) repeat protein
MFDIDDTDDNFEKIDYEKRSQLHFELGLQRLGILKAILYSLPTISNLQAADEGIQKSVELAEETLAYFQQALLDIRQRDDHSPEEAGILFRIGETLDKIGYSKRAQVYYEEAMPIYREIGNQEEAYACFLIGSNYFGQGQIKSAIQYLSQSLDIGENHLTDQVTLGLLDEHIHIDYQDSIDRREIESKYKQALNWDSGWRRIVWKLLVSPLLKHLSKEERVRFKIRPIEDLPDLYGLPIQMDE